MNIRSCCGVTVGMGGLASVEAYMEEMKLEGLRRFRGSAEEAQSWRVKGDECRMDDKSLFLDMSQNPAVHWYEAFTGEKHGHKDYKDHKANSGSYATDTVLRGARSG